MPKHIAFLHTSPLHVSTFERLVAALDARVQTEHVVSEALLADAQRFGADDPSLVTRIHEGMRRAAASTGASVVVCTCSTIGSAAERTPTNGRFSPMRIDRAMADRAVALGPRVLVVAALESTLDPSKTLLEESALALGVAVEIEYLVAEGAWAHFLNGDLTAYIEAIANSVRAGAPHVAGVIVLAQASMAPAAELLTDLGIEVLSSPRLGMQRALAQLHS